MSQHALKLSIESYTHVLCRDLSTCRVLHDVLQLLQLAADTLLDQGSVIDYHHDASSPEGGDTPQLQWQQVLDMATKLGQVHHLRQHFYGLPFQEFGETLLSVVAPDWRPRLSPEQDQALFLRFFRDAPAQAALNVLVTHLSSVEVPSERGLRGGWVSITAVSAQVACELLEERFAAPDSPGMQQLLQSLVGRAGEAENGSQQQQGEEQQQQAPQSSAAAEAAAAALASLPDRAAACEVPLLLPAAFVPRLVGQVLSWLQQLQLAQAARSAQRPSGVQAASGGGSGSGEGAKVGAWQQALQFAADLLSRLSRRGHAQLVAAAVWEAMLPGLQQQCRSQPGTSAPPAAAAPAARPASAGTPQAGENGMGPGASSGDSEGMLAVAAAVVGSMADAGALDRLLEAFLRLLAAEVAASAEAGASSSNSQAAEASSSAGKASMAAAQPPAGPSEAGGKGRAGPAPEAISDSMALAALCALLPPVTWASRPDVRYALTDKLLTQRVLPGAALRWVILYLNGVSCGSSKCGGSSGGGGSSGSSTEADGQAGSQAAAAAAAAASDVLADVACQLARVWGDKTTIQRLPVRNQAYLTAALQQSMEALGGQRFQAQPDLLPAVLAGVGARLDSPQQAVRRQAMRVGHSMSLLLDPSKPLFEEDKPWELLPEEQWEESSAEQQARQAAMAVRQGAARAAAGSNRTLPGASSMAAGARAAGGVQKKGREQQGGKRMEDGEEEEWPLTETDSDDEMGAELAGSDDDLAPYNLEESDEEDAAKHGLQLRDLTSLLLNHEKDWKGQMRALRCAEELIRSAPDELEHYAVPLARALLHTPIPKWAAEETREGQLPPDLQRFRSLVAVVVEAPARTVLALAGEVYSSSIDMHHRDLILTTLATAAQEMAHPGSFLPPLPGTTPALALGAAAPARAGVGGSGGGGTGAVAGTGSGAPARLGRVTRANERALAAAKGKDGGAGGGRERREFVNRFPAMALSWAAALLRECDRPHHGIDLFGRDHFLLGRMLVTLGTFLECCTHTPQAVPLAATVLELVHSRRVHAHPEPYVRRASLLAVSQVMTSLPPARLSAAMLGALSSTDLQDQALVSRLDWAREWTEQEAETDPDEGCRKMAASCRQLQASLAAGALAALEAGGGEVGAGGLLGGGRGRAQLLLAPQQGVRVAVPRLEELRLK